MKKKTTTILGELEGLRVYHQASEDVRFTGKLWSALKCSRPRAFWL